MRLSSWLRSGSSISMPSGTEHGRRPTRPAKRFLPTQLSALQLEDRIVLSTFTVGNLADSGLGSLRAAITAANTNAGADVVAFTHGLRGTVALTSGELSITDDLRIDGPGALRLAVSGSDSSRVFNISSAAAASIDDLTITRGHGFLRGGGILNAGSLTLSDAVVSDNVVVGLPGMSVDVDPFGGGILNTGTLSVSHTTFVNNQSLGAAGNPGGPGSTGLGGAIMSVGTADAPATATVRFSTFLDNQAKGGAAGVGAPFTRAGLGGAIMNDAGTFTVSNSEFRDNQAVGGAGGGFPGGFGAGGAIANVALFGDAILSVSDSTLTDNQAVGGAAGAGTSAQIGRGGAIANFVAGAASLPVSVTATATVTGSTLLGNRAIGGAGATGGTGQGGAITNENGGVLTVSDALIALNQAKGGASQAGNGGNGLGGGIYSGAPNPFGTPSLTLGRSLVTLNRAAGGAAGGGGAAGLGQGGGLYLAPGGVASADSLTTIVFNSASTSDRDVFGVLIKPKA
jgi:hypothetical protein